MTVPPRVMSIAGLDPSGGAGLLADVESIRACGGQPLAVCAALTAQGDPGVRDTMAVPAPFVEAQIRAVGDVRGLKTGMLGSEEIVELVVGLVDGRVLPPPVVDPVTRSSSGTLLLDDAGIIRLRDELLPRSRATTPNLDEAAALTGRTVQDAEQLEDAARALVDRGVQLAVITGGHGAGDVVVDVVMSATDSAPWRLERPRVPGTARGTGCRFAAALATHLARGSGPREAVAAAGDLVERYVRSSSSGSSSRYSAR